MSSPRGRVVCVGAVVRQDDRVLFVRQAEGHPLGGQWSIPWGVVEPEESPAEAAVRESHEEGGVNVAIEGLLGVQDLPDSGWLAVVFLCRYVAGHPTPDGRETDGAAFFGRQEIAGFDEPFEPWCKWLALEVLNGTHELITERVEHPFAPSRGFL